MANQGKRKTFVIPRKICKKQEWYTLIDEEDKSDLSAIKAELLHSTYVCEGASRTGENTTDAPVQKMRLSTAQRVSIFVDGIRPQLTNFSW